MNEENAKVRLQEIETRFPIQDIEVNGKKFWPLLRSLIYAQLLGGLLRLFPRSYSRVFRMIVNALFGWPRWFGKYEFVFISNEMERRKCGNVYIDKLVEGIIQRVGHNNSLYIEHVKDRHLKAREYGGKKVVSFDLILILAAIYKIIKRPGHSASIKGEQVLKEILSAYNLNSDYREGIDTFLSKVFVLEIVFKVLKPKAVFITDYGSNSVIYAAKKLGIRTIELQHGVIGKVHPYYHPAIRLEEKFCPDYFLVFGTNDVEALSHGNYVSAKNIIPIGNYYLNRLSNEPTNKKVLALINGFEYAICIPTDYVNHNYLLDFICSVALDLSNCVFIFSPRENKLNTTPREVPENVKVIAEFSYQEIIRHCDYNSSTTSTCCIEAISLGAQNILIDEDGSASLYFGKVLTDRRVTRFAKSKDDYKAQFVSLARLSRDEVKEGNAQNYAANHDQQMHLVLDTLKTLD